MQHQSMPMMMRWAATLMVLTLVRCTSAFDTAVDSVGEPFVQPGKFNFLRCQDLVVQADAQEKRVKELHELIERSGDGVGAGAVNVFVYGPDLKEAESMLRLAHKTQTEKGCDKNNSKPGQSTRAVPVAATTAGPAKGMATAPMPALPRASAPPTYSAPAGNLDPLH
jgi:hypothetical protein